ncbi:MAG: MinD/ParA family protein [Oceanococcaceae bacterium]
MLTPKSGHQAQQLVGMQRGTKRTRVIAVASGKGGVGKTTLSINFSTALQMLNQRTVLFDADFGLANVDVLLGLQPRRHLGHVLEGQARLTDILVETGTGLRIVPSASGQRWLAEMSDEMRTGLIHGFSELAHDTDVLVIDTAAGITSNVLALAQAAQSVMVVVCDEPAAITDAYALIKVLSTDHRVRQFEVVANQTRSRGEGRNLFEKLQRVTDRFLEVHLNYAGDVPYDDNIRLAIQQQRTLVDWKPGSPAAQAIHELARKALTWPQPDAPRGHIEFFVESLARPQAKGLMFAGALS